MATAANHRGTMKITQKQESYLLDLINNVTDSNYRFLSQVREDGIGKRAKKVRGLSAAEASELITEWQAKGER